MFLAIIETSSGCGWVKIPLTITHFQRMVEYAKQWMNDSYPSLKGEQCYIVKILHELSDDGISQVVSSQFNKGTDHGTHVDVVSVNFNHMGFDPDLHVFICHKCRKALSCGNHKIPFCSCISGWIRPYQSFCQIKDIETE